MEAFETIRNRQMLLDSVINSTDDLIFFKDKNFLYLGCNTAFSQFVGKPKEYIIGKSDFDLFDKSVATLFREMDTLMLSQRTARSNNEWITYPDQHKAYMQTLKAPLEYAPNAFGVVGIARDISELYETQQKLKEQAYMDELTKIGNRKAFVKHLKEQLALFKRYNTLFSLLMYDIDDFKQVNDTYGHAVGDEVLIGIAHTITPIIREHDGHFRIGGEEFVILFPQTPLEQALPVAQKIRQAVEKLHIIEGRSVTISVGVAQANAEDTFESLFARVDALLYKAKHQGKNSVCS
ncbi:MAG: hypothetical protein KU37_04525 [Sulfuricurvum sp. PC08-66]|nr:MAG: hypothetical protein KU37_04525 [Sulfuricurvum sp. PC08-66]